MGALVTAPQVQLEVAAHWLQEAEILLAGRGGKSDSEQFRRVAEDCLRVASAKGDESCEDNRR